MKKTKVRFNTVNGSYEQGYIDGYLSGGSFDAYAIVILGSLIKLINIKMLEVIDNDTEV